MKVLFKEITVLAEDMKVIDNGYVAVDGDRIVYVGETEPKGEFDRIYDGKGKLLMSGFFNGHAHAPMTLLRGYGENLKLQDWLNTRIFPFEAKLDGEAVYWGTMLSMAESFRFGIVSTSDMYYFCKDMAKAYIESGAKGNISRSLTNFTGEEPTSMKSFKEAMSFYDNYHNAADGRIKVDMSLHAEYTSDEATARALAEAARERDTIMHIHVSETAQEHQECIERHGKTPAAYLADAGLFDVPAIAAHCVYSTEEDLDIFKAKGVTVSTNPVSNMKLASGICNASKVMAKGVNLAIGTDSVASNNSLNFIEEIKVLAIGNKAATGDPTAITPAQALIAATKGGAIAQGRDDSGVIKAGNKADLIVMDISAPYMHPVHSIVNNMVYSISGSDVLLTMIDGKVVYEDGHYCTIDIEKVIYEVERITANILERL
jgi:5-methylthioadenosine/S-adenosylhomocysteine deaminase